MRVRVKVVFEDSVGVQNGQIFIWTPLVPMERRAPSVSMDGSPFSN